MLALYIAILGAAFVFLGAPKKVSASPNTQKSLKGLNGSIVKALPLIEQVLLATGNGLNGKFIITSALRTEADQQKLKAMGYFPALNSLHLKGHAVDIASDTPIAAREALRHLNIAGMSELISYGYQKSIHVGFDAGPLNVLHSEIGGTYTRV